MNKREQLNKECIKQILPRCMIALLKDFDADYKDNSDADNWAEFGLILNNQERRIDCNFFWKEQNAETGVMVVNFYPVKDGNTLTSDQIGSVEIPKIFFRE